MNLKKCPKRSISRENKGGGQTLYGKILQKSNMLSFDGFPQVELIHVVWYRLIVETCSKIHCEVAPSFPAGVSRVCYGRQHMVFVCDFLCVLAKFVQKIINFSQKPEKVTQHLAHKLIQGSSECFHVLFILI